MGTNTVCCACMKVEMVANNIRARRCVKGITKAHLSRQVGVSRGYIARLEDGLRMPSVPVMFRITRYFQRNVEQVFQYRAGPRRRG
jgi:DNA-binding XRE family transcriptional regulator